MLSIKNISYSIKDKPILKDINLEIKDGECLALLGPNGAGKSSLIDIITGAVKPDSGQATINELPFKKVKKNAGVLYEYVPLFYYSKIKEIIAYICSVHNVKRKTIQPIIQALEIDKLENKLVKVLSKGERKKIGILMTIVHNPNFIILDEPTSDLDPFMRDTAWDFFMAENRTVFFTTHLWEEAEKKAERIAFICDGQILAVDTPENFLSDKYLVNQKKIVLTNGHNPEFNGIKHIKQNDEVLVYPDNVDSFVSSYKPKNYAITEIDLKDVYLHLTNKF
jgi:ABC-2 type transport system ATP-binding protein